jgi:glycerate kinase
VPCVAVCGQLDLLAGLVRKMGFAGAFPIGRGHTTLDGALAATEVDLAAMGAALAGLWGAAQAPG